MRATRHRRQDGFTMVEVLIVSSLFLVILTATLMSFTTFERTTRGSERTAEQVEVAREELDRIARQMRNLARRIDVPVITRATGDDVIFQTSVPSRVWVRYCLETSGDRSRLWKIETNQPSPSPAMSGGAGAACPGPAAAGTGGITRMTIAAPYVRNATASPPEPIFRYTCSNAPPSCPRPGQLNEDSTRLKSIGMSLLVDVDQQRKPPATRVSSGVFLRNQNEPPTADFVSTSLGNRRVLLNGSSSQDPEGRTLQYFFYKGTSSTGSDVPVFTCDAPPLTNPNILRGIAPTYLFPSTETQAYFTLKVCDAGDLQATSTTKLVKP
jgi:prepilin-type N-terminal cleavage/methylation domain-containing protein